MNPIRPLWERGLCSLLAALMALPANVAVALAQSLDQTVIVNEGGASRSVVTNVTFRLSSGLVPVPGGQSVFRQPFGPALSPTNLSLVSLDQTNLYRLSFTNLPGNRLPDGNYLVSLLTAPETNTSVARRADTVAVHALFGDHDGDRDVDFLDTHWFRAAWSRGGESPGYDARFDADGDGRVGPTDLALFSTNYFTVLPPAPGVFAYQVSPIGEGPSLQTLVAGAVFRTDPTAILRGKLIGDSDPEPGEGEIFSHDLSGDFDGDQSFGLSKERLENLLGRPLEAGVYRLALQLVDPSQHVSARFVLPLNVSGPCQAVNPTFWSTYSSTNASPGTAVGAVSFDGCAILLEEGGSFLTTAERTFEVPATGGHIEVAIEHLRFDGESEGHELDAFEIAVVDGGTLPLAFTVQGQGGVVPASVSTPPALPPTPNSLFNVSEGRVPVAAPGVSFETVEEGLTVRIDTAAFSGRSDVRLSLRLINNDGDTRSSVRVGSVQLLPWSPPAAPGVGTPAFPLADGGPDAARALSSECGSDAQPMFNAGPVGHAVLMDGCVTPPFQPVAWWKGDGQALDANGTNHGTFAAQAGSVEDGRVGAAFRLYGRFDAINFGPMQQTDGAQELSVMAWVLRTRTLDNVQGEAVLSAWDPTQGTDKRFALYTTNRSGFAGAFSLWFEDNTEGAVDGLQVIPNGEWTHLAATWRSVDGKLSFYTNGRLTRSTVAGTGKRLSRSGAPSAAIGEVPGLSLHSPFGWVDEVVVATNYLGPEFIERIHAAGARGDSLCVARSPQIELGATIPASVAPGPLVLNGRALADNTESPDNSIIAVMVGGPAVEALSPSGQFWTTVEIRPGLNRLEIVAHDAAGVLGRRYLEILGTDCPVELGQLVERTGIAVPVHERTSFDNGRGRLYSSVRLQNVGFAPLRAPVVVGVEIDGDPSIQLLAPDRVSRDGMPYYDFSATIPGAGLQAGETSLSRALAFSNPKHLPFRYRLRILAAAGTAPRFTSAPLISGAVGNRYTYHARAMDPDGGPVTFVARILPEGATLDTTSGALRWAPTQEGSFSVAITALDVDGDSAEQVFDIAVGPSVGNRPPRFTSSPVTSAQSAGPAGGTEYRYQASATDPDEDNVVFAFGAGAPSGIRLDRDTGLIEWNPSSDDVGEHPIVLRADDGRGGIVEQRFAICVPASLTLPTPPTPAVDLVVHDIDTRGVVTGGQTLIAGGHVSVWLRNLGREVLDQPFEVLVFEDRNRDGNFDSRQDSVLARATNTLQVYPGTNHFVRLPVHGSIQFAGSPISVFVDSAQRVRESNEENNVSESHNECVNGALPRSFDPVVKWTKSQFQVAPSFNQVMMTPAVIDLNRDGVPEIIFSSYEPGFTGLGGSAVLRVIRGDTGEEVFSVTDPDYLLYPASGIAVGDLEGDGSIEIVGYTATSEVVVFDAQGLPRWKRPAVWPYSTPALADVDGDGIAEILSAGTLFNHDGSRRWDRSPQQGTNTLSGYGHSIFADLDLDGRPEIIGGASAYNADGEWLFGNTVESRGFASIGDFDGDGYPEIVSVNRSGLGVQLLDRLGAHRWTYVHTNHLGGFPLIADLTGDGIPEIGIAGNTNYIVLDRDKRVLWSKSIADTSSGSTGSSAFDFNGDGEYEVVFADELNLYVWRGRDGAELFKYPKPNGTLYELPVIADVDGDGYAELVGVASGGQPGENGIIVFGNRAGQWAATRSIWNQHSYHISNINDDGTIPRQEPNGWQLYNSYRANAFPAKPPGTLLPDLLPSFARLDIEAGVQRLTVRVGNAGSAPAPGGVFVSAFAGDPRRDATLLGVGQIEGEVGVGSFRDVSLSLTNAGVGEVWVVVDNDGRGRGKVDSCQKENDFYPTDWMSPLTNLPPRFTTVPVTTAQEGLPYEYVAGAVDNDDGDQIQYSLLLSPEGMTMDSNSGLLRWSPGSDVGGGHVVVIAAWDSRGAASVQSFILSVEERLNLPPIVLSEPSLSTVIGESYFYATLTFDGDGDELVFGLALGPVGMTINKATGLLAWRPQIGQIGNHDVILRVEDGRAGVTVQSFVLLVVKPNLPPVLVEQELPLAASGQPYSFQFRAYDPEGSPVRFSFGEVRPGNAPNLDPETGLLSWIPPIQNSPFIEMEIVVTDADGASTRRIIPVSLAREREQHAPVFVSSPRLETRLGDRWSYLVRAEDLDAEPLVLRLLEGPEGMLLTNQVVSADGRVWTAPAHAAYVIWTPGVEDVEKRRQVVLEVGDASGNRRIQRFEVHVSNTLANSAPRITSAPGAAASVGRLFTYALVATDPDHDQVEWRLVDGPVGASLDPERSVVQWIPSSEQVGFSRFVVEVSDGLRGVDRQEFEVRVSCANAAPHIISYPNLAAQPGELYAYPARAVDPEGESLRWELVGAPDGATLDPATGLLRWNVSPGTTGERQFSIAVLDPLGGRDEQSFSLYVSEERKNRPPTISSLPPALVSAGRGYRYLIQAEDLDRDALTVTIARGPGGAVVESIGGLPGRLEGNLVWDVPADRSGPVDFSVEVRDSQGGVARQSFFVNVRPNSPPRISSTPSTNALPGVPYIYGLRPVDQDGDRLTFKLIDGPTGMILDENGILRWTPGEPNIGDIPVIVEVRDDLDGLVRQEFNIRVSPDTEPPRVSLTLVSGEIDRFSGSWVGDLGSTIAVRIQATDNAGVHQMRLKVDGVEFPLDPSGLARLPVNESRNMLITGEAFDLAGNRGVTSQPLLVRDPNAADQLSVTILSPVQGSHITKRVPVVATITNSGPIQSYRVDYALAEDVDLQDVASGEGIWTTLSEVSLEHPTNYLHEVVVAQFDPLSLINDTYVIRVFVQPETGLGWYEPVLVSTEGELKFGEFRVAFNDLTVPLSGIPITISRVYDSRLARREGDFGYGWQLGIQDARIRVGAGNRGLYPGARVYLTSPDGRRIGFTAEAQVQSALPFGLLAAFNYVFVPDAGVFERLESDAGIQLAGLGSSEDLFDGVADPDGFTLTTRDGTRYAYSRKQGLQSITDTTGNRIAYTRDGVLHFPAGSTNSDQGIQFVRDARGRIERVLPPLGPPLVYTYDAVGDLRAFTDLGEHTTRYAYDSARAHFLTNIVDPFGKNALGLVYDETGKLKEVRDVAGNPIQQDFDAEKNVGTFTDARGTQTIVHFDTRGNETNRVIPGISTNYFAYDENDNLTNAVNGRGYATNFVYDAKGNVTRITDALTNVTEIAYNELGKPTSVTNALKQVLHLRYDPAGHLTEVVNNLGFTTRVGRDAQGRVTNLVDAVKNTNSFIYEGGCSCGRPGVVFNPDGSFRRYEYDSLGRTNAIVSEIGGTNSSSYFADGRVRWTEDPLGNRTTFVYEGTRLTSIVDALQRETQFRYDDFGRTNQIITAEGGTNQFRYDENGNRTHVVDAVGNVTRFVYDAANRLTNRIDTFGNTNHFILDAGGNQIETIDRNGRRRTFAYDALGRMTNEVWWEGTNVVKTIAFAFNELGVQTYSGDDVAQYDYRIDGLNRLGRMLAKSAGVPDFALVYTYTPNGQVESVTDNWGVRVGSKYDSRNRLEQRTWQGGDPSALPVGEARVDFGFDAAGNRTSIARYADLSGTTQIGGTTNAYNPAGIVTNITHLGPTGETIARYDYDFDSAWQIRQWTINGQSSIFDYDRTGQLTNALNTAQPNENFRYDANGNREAVQSSGNYSVGGNNQVLSDGTNNYTYDFEGNMASRSNTVTGVLTTYQWDHRNRLMSVLDYNPGGVVAQTVAFVYDAMNRRMAKRVTGPQGTDIVRYLYNGDDPWADLDADNALTARYLNGPRIDELLARQRKSDGRGWYLTDHLGTVRDIANAAGAVVARVDYNSFGSVLHVSNEAAGDRFLFTGRELDGETGLYFLRARYLTTDFGRFLSEDPLGLQASDYSLYRYAMNSPGIFADPYGQTSSDYLAISLYTRYAVRAIIGLAVATAVVLFCEHVGPMLCPPEFRDFLNHLPDRIKDLFD